MTDFAPVGLAVLHAPNMLVSRQSIPRLTSKDWWLGSKPIPTRRCKAPRASAASATSPAFFFRKPLAPSYQFIPYRGLGPAMQDLVAGRVDLMIDVPINSLPYVRDGKLKAYAILGEQRVTIAPEVPTADEAGVPGVHLQNWYSIYAPKGTPKDVVARLNAACVEAAAGAARPFGRPRFRPAPARATEPGCARGAAAGGDRQVGTDHQGGRHQARVVPGCLKGPVLRRRKSEQFGRISTKISLRIFSSSTQSSIMSSKATSFGIGLKYCGCGQSEPHNSCVGAYSTSLCTSGSVSENGNFSWFEMRGDNFTQQRPVSRQRSMNLNPAPSMPLAGLTPPICSMKFPGGSQDLRVPVVLLVQFDEVVHGPAVFVGAGHQAIVDGFHEPVGDAVADRTGLGKNVELALGDARPGITTARRRSGKRHWPCSAIS